MPQSETLDRIRRGGRVRVVGVTGDDPIARRLDDLGIRSGVEIEVIRRAPLGDPTLFELHGYQLCLRRSESVRVRVESAADSASLDPSPPVPSAKNPPPARSSDAVDGFDPARA